MKYSLLVIIFSFVSINSYASQRVGDSTSYEFVREDGSTYNVNQLTNEVIITNEGQEYAIGNFQEIDSGSVIAEGQFILPTEGVERTMHSADSTSNCDAEG